MTFPILIQLIFSRINLLVCCTSRSYEVNIIYIAWSWLKSFFMIHLFVKLINIFIKMPKGVNKTKRPSVDQQRRNLKWKLETFTRYEESLTEFVPIGLYSLQGTNKHHNISNLSNFSESNLRQSQLLASSSFS